MFYTKQVDDEQKIKNDAAIVIQSGYRGYTVRNNLKLQRKDHAADPEPIDTTTDVQVVKSGDEIERQPTPEPVARSASPPKESAPSPHEEVEEESRALNSATKESSRPESRESVSKENPEDANERQPSPEDVVPSQPLVDSKNDEDANSRSSKSPTVSVPPEETEHREATPVEKSQPDEQSPHADIPSEVAHTPSNVGINDDEIDTGRSDEAVDLPKRDDGDGTDDEKNRNVPPSAGNESESEEAHEPSVESARKSPR